MFEVPVTEFPVFFVSAPDGYRYVTRAQLDEILISASDTSVKDDEVLFNVYQFTSEYLWGVENGGGERHFHITKESLAYYRKRKGTLFEIVANEA